MSLSLNLPLYQVSFIINKKEKEWKGKEEKKKPNYDSDEDFEQGGTNYRSRRTKPKSIIGDFTYMGKDKVRSKEYAVLIASVLLIGIPSVLTAIFMYD